MASNQSEFNIPTSFSCKIVLLFEKLCFRFFHVLKSRTWCLNALQKRFPKFELETDEKACASQFFLHLLWLENFPGHALVKYVRFDVWYRSALSKYVAIISKISNFCRIKDFLHSFLFKKFVVLNYVLKLGALDYTS